MSTLDFSDSMIRTDLCFHEPCCYIDLSDDGQARQQPSVAWGKGEDGKHQGQETCHHHDQQQEASDDGLPRGNELAVRGAGVAAEESMRVEELAAGNAPDTASVAVGALGEDRQPSEMSEKRQETWIPQKESHKQFLKRTMGEGTGPQAPPEGAGVLAQIRWQIRLAVQSKPFMYTIMVVILLNTIMMATEHHGQPDSLIEVQTVTNLIFTIIFALEMVLKLIGLGIFEYLSDQINIFDAFIVVTSRPVPLLWHAAACSLPRVSCELSGSLSDVSKIPSLLPRIPFQPTATAVSFLPCSHPAYPRVHP